MGDCNAKVGADWQAGAAIGKFGVRCLNDAREVKWIKQYKTIQT